MARELGCDNIRVNAVAPGITRTDMVAALPEAVIYVYDNNSTDGTDEIARKEGAVVRYEYQQGKET